MTGSVLAAPASAPSAMTSPAQSAERDAVSPLELFFDLVFVFAVSQLSRDPPPPGRDAAWLTAQAQPAD